MTSRHLTVYLALVPALFVFGAGCSKKEAAAPLPPPEVTVAKPVSVEYTETLDLTGLLVSPAEVEIRSRVTGYLEEILFHDGAEVKKGDILFRIDQRPFRAAVMAAEADLQRAKAKRSVAEAEFKRADKVKSSGAISVEEVGARKATFDEADAAVISAQAALENANLNLEFTEIRSPVTGRVSDSAVSAGSLIVAGTGGSDVLTRVVQMDKMRADVELDESQLHRLMKMRDERKLTGPQGGPMFLSVGDDRTYPFKGAIDFVDNRLGESTGTLRIRGEFDNSARQLGAGMFARVKLPVGAPSKALFTDEAAIGTDQHRKFVYVVGADDKVTYRPVSLGATEQGFVQVLDGVGPDDRIIVTGILRARPGLGVKPTEVTLKMPPLAGFATQDKKEQAE